MTMHPSRMFGAVVFVSIAIAAALLLASASSVSGQVNVDIGITLPSSPRLVIIPDTRVYYAPDVAANYFRYGKEYWVFREGQWYVARKPRGPWSLIERERVPVPILSVPVRYYRAAPEAWRDHAPHHPPRWEPQYGQKWDEQHYRPPQKQHDGKRGRE
jgi:hypothetical protein